MLYYSCSISLLGNKPERGLDLLPGQTVMCHRTRYIYLYGYMFQGDLTESCSFIRFLCNIVHTLIRIQGTLPAEATKFRFTGSAGKVAVTYIRFGMKSAFYNFHITNISSYLCWLNNTFQGQDAQ